MINKKEERLELEPEQEHPNSENHWDINSKNSLMDALDVIGLSEELGEMELKNFLYKR